MVFIFGYMTCKTFYFLNTTRLSLKLIKSSRVIYLLMASRAVENYIMSETIMKKYLAKNNEKRDAIRAFEDKCASELEHFKVIAIKQLISQTPDAFKPGLEFDDWNTAMLHLQRHREEALNFWRMGND